MDRLQILIGKENYNKIRNAEILIIGLGGVGSNAAESLVRNGFKNFTLVDYDKVELSNFNRHSMGLKRYLNEYKCIALKNYLSEIYDDLNINVIKEKFDFKTYNKILNKKYDFVVDAIDKLSDKIELIIQCIQNKIKIISAMGAGGKINANNVKISDIKYAYGDRLLKRVKKNLKKHNIEKGVPVVYCVENTKYIIVGNKKIIGSCSHIPAIFGNLISGYIFNYIVEN